MNLVNLFLFTYIASTLEVLSHEPSIQCTIVKVREVVNLEKIGTFPKLYQTIENDPMTSRLFIAAVELTGVNPKTQLKTINSETINMEYGKTVLALELKGKPISRNGLLKMNDKILAEVTCH